MPPPQSAPGVSRRAVLIGLLFCLAIAVGEPYGILVVGGSPLTADFSTGAAIFLFFVLTLVVNPLARLVTGSGLRRGELATVHIMMIVAAAIPSWGFTLNLIPLLGGFFYYATPENGWALTIQENLPPWLLPDDPGRFRTLFEGVGDGQAAPWAQWLQPLLMWWLFICSVYFATLCLLVILRRQWVERERLLFPLAILPLQMSGDGEGGRLPAFFRSKVMWVGFLVPTCINTVNALHSYFHYIPRIELRTSIWILRDAVRLDLTPHFEIVGLSYLLNTDVSLGVWFFAFLAHLQTGAQRLLGWSIGPTQPFSDPGPPTVSHMAMGALVFLVASGFWNARAHLADVLRKALLGAAEIDDSDEPLSYRTAVIGALLGSASAMVWLTMAGLTPLAAAVLLATALVTFIGIARIVSQTGLAYCRSPVGAPIFAVNVLGTALVEPSGIVALGLSFAWNDLRTFVMASAATGLKMAEVTRLECRRLFPAIAAAIVVALLGSAWAILSIAYTHGGINLMGWQFRGIPIFSGDWITRNINNPQAFHSWHLGFTVVGGMLMAAMTYLKNHIMGFPFHPIGLALGLTHPVSSAWFSVFLAWSVKAAILKYGGASLYLGMRPLFLGLVLGTFVSAGVWLVVDALTGVTGNVFTFA
ncbi:MAG TPA: DUF6785 family protein [Candidatus Latescibacteria bacterium]|jgi:hypothetical protein|nr:DUF6785 family protein [Candidatus Latescibacterota bacterium]